MTGRLIAVVGPSGVGKDTVMAAMIAAEPRLRLVRRVITRPANAGGEVFDAVDIATFHSMQADGAFALSWSAHETLYGIPASIDGALRAGHDLVANLSRSVLSDAQTRFDQLHLVSLTAHQDVLADRLAHRGREDHAQIKRRLARAGQDLPANIKVVEIDNSGPLDETVTAILAHLYPVNA